MPSSLDLSSLPAELQAKWSKLEERLRSLGKTLVAFSGGVDSAFLAWAAHRAAPGKMLAVLADSPSLARSELRQAQEFCRVHGIPLEIISTGEMERPEYVRNDSMRCFHCKDELFTVIERRRDEQGFETVAYGINLDDQGDYRPGQQAARRHGVAAPLLEAAFTKQEIREVARVAGLEIWDKPAAACLSSRIEYGREVTVEALRQVEEGEEALRALGFRQLRVRHHGAIARVEIARDELPRALSPQMAEEFARILKGLGFTYVTLDLEGFRSGSMNAILPAKTLEQHRA